MPTIRLTDRTIAALKSTPSAQCDYFDRALPGFGVRVSPRGKKTFILLYRNQARRLRRQTLGKYPLVSLATAREDAQAALRKATTGRDPATEQKTAQKAAVTQTFGALAQLYMEKHAMRKKRSWRSDARMIRRELEAWRDRPVASLRRRDVLDVLEGIVARGAPILANRVLSLISKMLNFGLGLDGWLEANVAAKLSKPSTEQSRSRVLTEAEIKTVWAHLSEPPPDGLEVNEARYWKLTRAALRLRLITAQRGKEVLSMRCADIEGSWWTIPADIAKNKLPHRVWLSAPALRVLATLKGDGNRDHVFKGIVGPRQRRGALEGLEVNDVRPHDFRRTAASTMASGGVPRLTISKILNHMETGVTAIYDRHSYDPEKKAALIWWGAKLDAIVNGKRSRVLPFARGA
jgi:integrase